ncbi:hypothetical protein ABVT39_006104 [Epinephelus coioides]
MNALLMVYLEGLIQDLESKCPAEFLPEMAMVVDTVIQGARTQARFLGNSLVQLTMTRQHIWLSQSGLLDSDQAAVIDAEITLGEVFGPAVEAVLDEAQKVQQHTESIHQPGQSRLLAWRPPERRVSFQRPRFAKQDPSHSSDRAGRRVPPQQSQGNEHSHPRSGECAGRGAGRAR